MPTIKYQDDIEMIAPDENETKQKIVDVMTQGMEGFVALTA